MVLSRLERVVLCASGEATGRCRKRDQVGLDLILWGSSYGGFCTVLIRVLSFGAACSFPPFDLDGLDAICTLLLPIASSEWLGDAVFQQPSCCTGVMQ